MPNAASARSSPLARMIWVSSKSARRGVSSSALRSYMPHSTMHLAGLVAGCIAPAVDRLALGAQALDESRDLVGAQAGVEPAPLVGHHVEHELPHEAVVAHHCVEVCLAELVGRAVGEELDEARGDGMVLGDARDAADAGPRDGFELALGGVLERVALLDVCSECGGVGEAVLEHQAGDDAHLAREPLFAGDGAAVCGGCGHARSFLSTRRTCAPRRRTICDMFAHFLQS